MPKHGTDISVYLAFPGATVARIDALRSILGITRASYIRFAVMENLLNHKMPSIPALMQPSIPALVHPFDLEAPKDLPCQ